jgi:hypothetical protein
VCGIACGGLHNAVWTETVSQTNEIKWTKKQQENKPYKLNIMQLQDKPELTAVSDCSLTVRLSGSCVYLGLL